jgi:putative SOS response-associated peptidase YedK
VTDANELVRPIHNRMLVILKPEDYSLWLDPAMTQAHTIKPLLQPYPAEEMAAWRVSTRVNNARQEDPGLTEPLASDSNPSLF